VSARDDLERALAEVRGVEGVYEARQVFPGTD